MGAKKKRSYEEANEQMLLIHFVIHSVHHLQKQNGTKQQKR